MATRSHVVGPHLEESPNLGPETAKQFELRHKPGKTMDSGEEQVVMAVEVLALVRDHGPELAR